MVTSGLLAYGREAIRYEVHRLARRRTLTIEVHPDGRVVVRAPEGCPDAVVAERLCRRAAWIRRQIKEFEGYRPRTPPRHYVPGESHLYLGRQYRLEVGWAESTGVCLTRGRLRISLPGQAAPGCIRSLLHRWYLDRAKEVFTGVLDQALGHFTDVPRPRLFVRTMRSRWGSLSRRGAMTLNTDLVRAPRACIEYVVTHELCHLEYRNHDARFYRRLEQVMPDWQARKRRLEAALL